MKDVNQFNTSWLHDAIMISFEMEWATATAKMHMRTGVVGLESIVLVAHGVRELQVPRYEPWGPSIHINSTSTDNIFESEEMTGIALRIEMQSGDVIKLNCGTFNIAPST